MTHRHHSGGIQEYAAHLIERLGGLISKGEPKHAAPESTPPVDDYVTADEWAHQHAHKAGA